MQVSDLSTLSLSYGSSFPTPALVPMEVSSLGGYDSLDLPISLFNFEGSSLPCYLTSLLELRRVVDFSVWVAFYLIG